MKTPEEIALEIVRLHAGRNVPYEKALTLNHAIADAIRRERDGSGHEGTD